MKTRPERDQVIVFDPDDESFGAPPGRRVPRIEGEPPRDADARRAVAAYRDLVQANGADRRGLPNVDPRRASLSVVCDAGQRQRRGCNVGRVFVVGRDLLFVGAVDLSKGSSKSPAGVLRTIAYVKVAARFLSSATDDHEYPVKCRCSLSAITWVDRDKVSEAFRAQATCGHAAVPTSAVLSRYAQG